LREFEWSQLLAPSSLELEWSTYKRREGRLMVLAIEPCPMPSLEKSFQRKVEEASVRAGLKTYTPNNLSVSGTRVIFREKVVFEQREVWWDP
jgi:hypothetical protein